MKNNIIIEKGRCVACGVCAKACPRIAIDIINGCYAQIDSNKCVRCGICIKNCPANIIERGIQ